jgi:hypothetical protein
MNRLKTAFAYFLALLTIALFLLFVVLRQTSAFSFDVSGKAS